MKIYYEDTYGEQLYSGTADGVPRIGDTVQISGSLWYVTEIVWEVETGSVAVILSENQAKVRSTDNVSDVTSGRLRETNNAIMQANKRIDATEKKGRVLAEKISTVKKHLNTTIQQIKKEPT